MLAGEYNPGGVAVADRTQCQTDTFTITNQVTVPVICGTNSGFHGELLNIVAKTLEALPNLHYLISLYKGVTLK